MTAPEVGLPTVLDGGCAYSYSPDQPACGRPGVVHLCVRSAAWGVVALATCAEHEPIARAAGEVLDGHPHVEQCGMTECWVQL